MKARRSAKRTYTVDLALEAMLEVDRVSGRREHLPYVQWVMEQRGDAPDAVIPYESQPFCHVNYKLYEVTGDRRYVRPFVDETALYRRGVTRSAEGAIAHYPDRPGRNLLIDMLQDYASRMAQAGALSGDATFASTSASSSTTSQHICCTTRTPACRGQGNGWLEDPMAAPPTARGGLADAGHGGGFPLRPAAHARDGGCLHEFADALLTVCPQHRELASAPAPSRRGEGPDSTGTGADLCDILPCERAFWPRGVPGGGAGSMGGRGTLRETEEGVVAAPPAPAPDRSGPWWGGRTPGLRGGGEPRAGLRDVRLRRPGVPAREEPDT